MLRRLLFALLLLGLLPNYVLAAGYTAGGPAYATPTAACAAASLSWQTWVGYPEGYFEGPTYGATHGYCITSNINGYRSGFAVGYSPCAEGQYQSGTSCVSSCPTGTEPEVSGAVAMCVTQSPGFVCTYLYGVWTCSAPPCTVGEVKEGFAATSGTQRYGNCNYELNPNEPSKEIYSGVFTGTHGTWVNTGVSNVGDNTLTVPGSPETPCEGLDCCLYMTGGLGYAGELAPIYCEEFWTEEDKSTESYYKY